MRYLLSILFFVFIVLSTATAEVPQTDEAERIYNSHGDAIYQIQVIDLASGKKTSIGSGFQFTAEGFIATNYHVVAEAIQRPDKNRIEYLHDKGAKGELKVMIADVIHDLAIVKMDKPGAVSVELGRSKLPKGAKIFSLGNPHDIGFTIVEGTYNGLSKESFIDKIHFSGSLNPGMSGGPALGHDGKVVGVNVSTAGNQISFLVPVEPLRMLLVDYFRQPEGYDFIRHSNSHIEDQLQASQKRNLSILLGKEWESVPFGMLMVPGRIHDAFKCWGGPGHAEKDPFQYFRSICSSQDQLFLDDGFETGIYSYRYDLITGKEKMNLVRFYNYYEGQYGLTASDSNAGEDDVTNYECNNRFIDLAGFRWKTSFCVRQYKKYPDTFDMQFYMALVGNGKEGMLVSLVGEGVSKENALAMTKRFMDEIKPVAQDVAVKIPVPEDVAPKTP